MNLIKKGQYAATLQDYGIIDHYGALKVVLEVSFNAELQDNSFQKMTMTWKGNLSDEKKARFAIKTLQSIGLKTNDVRDLVKGKESGCLEIGKEVMVTIDHFTTEDGKTFNVIKYVNPSKSNAAPSAELLQSHSWLKSLTGGTDDIPF